jgi:hypothetical protein
MRCGEYNSTPVSVCVCPVPSVTSSLLATPHVLAPAGTQPRNPSPLIRSLSSTKAARCLQVYSLRVSSPTLLDNPSVAPHRQLTDVFLAPLLDPLFAITLSAEKVDPLSIILHRNVSRPYSLAKLYFPIS